MIEPSDIKLLVLGGGLPEATSETLSQSGIDVSRVEHVEAALDELASREFDCVLVIGADSDVDADAEAAREDDRLAPSELHPEFLDVPMLFEIDDGGEPWLEDALATGAADYVRATDLAEHGELLVHRIRTLVDAARPAFSRGDGPAHERPGWSAKHLRTLFEHAPDSIVVHDADGEIVDVNRAAVDALGYSRAELLSMNVRDVEVGLDHDELRESWEELPAEEPLVEEGLHRRKDGTTYPAEVWVDAVEIEGKRQFVAMSRDISERKERRQELRKLTERLELAVEGANLGVWDFDMRTNEIAVSEKWAEILGYAPEEIDPDLETWRELIHPEDRPEIESMLEEYAAGERQRHDTEHRKRTADGDWRWVRDIGRIAERDDDGTPTRAVGIQLDIDERKRAERRLEQFEEAIERTAHAVYITDVDGEIEYVNPAFEEITGYSEEEVTGETPSLLKSGEYDDAFYEELWETILDGEQWEHKMVDERKDGERLVVNQTISPLVDEDGDVERFVAVAQDVTDRKERERQLRRFEAFVENSPTMVTLLDTDGTVLLDKSGIDVDWRHPPEEFLETNVLEYIHPEDQNRVTEALDALFENPGEPMSVEFRFRGRDETWHWLRTSAVNHEDDPLIGGIIAISIDVTEEKRRERELEQYEALVESAGDVLWMFDTDFSENLVINDAYEEVLGQPTAALDEEATAFLEAVHPDDRERLRRGMERLQEGEPIDLELRVNPQADFGRWLWVKGNPVYEDGEPLAFAGFARDVTERRERERELERHRTYLESANDMLTLIDPDGTIEYTSPAVERILGYEPADLVGENGFEYVHPDDREDQIENIERVAGEPGAEAVLEFRFRCADGSYCWIESTVRNLLEEEDVEGILLSSRDITERKRYEQELAAERDFLDTIIDSLPYPFYVLDVDDYTVEHANSKAAIGPGETCYEVTHRRDRPCDEGEDPIACPISEVTETGESAAVEHVHYDEEGKERIFEVRAAPIFDDEGNVTQIAESNIDVTERVEHERRLSALHGATRRLIDADSPEDVAEIAAEAASDLLDFSLPSMWFPDEDGEIELIANSEEHQQLLEEAGTPEPTHPPDSWLWDVIESGETVVRSPLSTEDLAADVPLHSAIVLPLGEHGLLACAARGEVDFSDRQVRIAEILAQNVQVALDQLEQRNALERQKQFTDDLLDAIEDVVYVIDTDGDLIEWNRALEKVTGYSSEEIDSMNAADFFAGEDSEAAAAAVEEAFETGRTRVELDFQTADGESIPYEFSANSFEAPDGEPVMAGIGRDRSLHVEYERTLEEQRDNLEILNQVVRHDIRNDMTVVRGRARLLEDHVDEAGREDLEAVLESTESAIELTKTARDLSETMLSTEEDVEPVRLDRHLEGPIENARSQFRDAVITADRIPDVRVRGNDLLEAMFRNLIGNAIVHNDEPVPEVRVSTAIDEETVTVSVADNGPGIPDEQKEMVFGKGEKGLESAGTGIGLYLVRTLLEQYGGDVWIEDNEPKGSVFYVELPRADDA